MISQEAGERMTDTTEPDALVLVEMTGDFADEEIPLRS
jgi:hypothetical protein